ncbi:hypothetical protein A9K55_001588 [Cordyceps militaris]|uniref:Uncharacterized protein n=1 Tax=Cordyceps militaris TaxID=73501 RepID=A0A2H4SS50_CORMI|nr:hypothetical protein A9K55_001588 [Cordyceps militaris]
MPSSSSTNRIMISLFFRERLIPTQNECDDFARAITQSPLSLALLQGASSYNARETYGNLWAYKIMRMQGVPVYALRANPPGDVDDSPFCRTVLDFASWSIPRSGSIYHHPYNAQGQANTVPRSTTRFCAAAWKNRPANQPPPRATLQNEYLAALHKIGLLLSDRFQADVDLARDAAWRLFEGDWPMVINNGNVLGLLLQQAPHSLGSSWRTLEGVLPDHHPVISFLASALLGQG